MTPAWGEAWRQPGERHGASLDRPPHARSLTHSPALPTHPLQDLVRILHASEATPVEFICPLTTCVMTDPVLLHETGHSYEVCAGEEGLGGGWLVCAGEGAWRGMAGVWHCRLQMRLHSTCEQITAHLSSQQ